MFVKVAQCPFVVKEKFLYRYLGEVSKCLECLKLFFLLVIHEVNVIYELFFIKKQDYTKSPGYVEQKWKKTTRVE